MNWIFTIILLQSFLQFRTGTYPVHPQILAILILLISQLDPVRRGPDVFNNYHAVHRLIPIPNISVG